MTTLEMLIGARARVSLGWVQGISAVSADGQQVSPASLKATNWCAFGAIVAETGGLPDGDSAVLQALAAALPAWRLASDGSCASSRGVVVHYNDDPRTSQTDVLALYDRAINRYPKVTA